MTFLMNGACESMQKARQLWRKAHLWLSLATGVWIAVLGLSGSVLVYYESLDRQLNPSLFECGQTQVNASLEQAYASVRAIHPTTRVFSIYRGDALNEAWRAYVQHPQNAEESLEILFCPGTGEQLGSRGWASGELSRSTVFSWAYALHYSLLLRGEFWGNTGQYVVGGMGVALVLSLLSGLILWWPRGGKWRQALWLKPGARGIRRYFDWHRVSGYLSIVPLLLIALSGVQMAFGQWINPLVNKIAPLHNYALEDPVLSPSDRPRMTLDQLYQTAQAVFPQAQLNGVRFGDEFSGMSMIFLQPDELRAELGTSRVVLDPWSGEILQVRNPLAGSAGDDLLEWMFPLHNGEAFGHFGRFIALVAGFIPFVLFVTGLSIWARRRRKHKASAATDKFRDPVEHALRPNLSSSFIADRAKLR